MKYFRPDSIEEALGLLKEGVPLAGGTGLTPRRYELDGVIDIQNLGLDEIRVTEEEIEIGAGAVLQELFSREDEFPAAILRACRLESNLNLRNMMTFGGLLVSGDARSPLLTMLTALDPVLHTEPGGKLLHMQEFLKGRSKREEGYLITRLGFPRTYRASYQQVARSPGDFPLVCAAACGRETDDGWVFSVSLGGFGAYPIREEWSLEQSADPDLIDQAAAWAASAYEEAGDTFASAEYRSEMAGLLTQRALREGMD